MLKETMERERDGITRLMEEPEEQYGEALEMLSACSGRVAFMGVGKSGHIAGKLAATFASLGFPPSSCIRRRRCTGTWA